MITVREFNKNDIPAMTEIWNSVVEDGIAFPQTETLSEHEAEDFFASQTKSAVAVDENGEIFGLYILHPNNIGRCSHIANASYAVRKDARGLHIGEKLVKDCMKSGAEAGYKILQFNAVVKSNAHARHLYERLGFVLLGTVPGGFRHDNGEYEDICLYYAEL